MSFSGTVRCSHCGQSGHNKAGCPKYKERIAQLRARDPDDYYVRQYDAAIAKRAASVKNRRCSYCNEQGHTRAGCKVMKEHKAQFQDDLILWRKAVLKWTKDIGLGIGAMVRSKNVVYRKNKNWMYPDEEGYVPPVGMVMNKMPSVFMTHHAGIGTAG